MELQVRFLSEILVGKCLREMGGRLWIDLREMIETFQESVESVRVVAHY